MQPRFFTFDGVDGGGKSTQIGKFVAWLEGRGRRVVTCRDPGGTALGERLREILLTDHTVHACSRSEMLLYMASRAQLVEEIIRPALAAGNDVVSDRFLLANVVYQGHAGGLNPDELWQVGAVATGGLTPDATFLLDMPAADSAARIQRSHDKMEARGVEYLERVRQGFLTEAARRAEVAIIDARPDPATVHAAVIAAAERVFNEAPR